MFEPAAAPETPFAVRVQVRPPHGRHPVLGGLVKGIFDGVICAFQAHTDTAVLPDVVARIPTVLPADPIEIEEHLLDQRRAVLGAVQQLVYPTKLIVTRSSTQEPPAQAYTRDHLGGLETVRSARQLPHTRLGGRW